MNNYLKIIGLAFEPYPNKGSRIVYSMCPLSRYCYSIYSDIFYKLCQTYFTNFGHNLGWNVNGWMDGWRFKKGRNTNYGELTAN